MELPNHAKQLLLQLNQQRAKGFLCDVIIVVENALFRAHKNILAASSMYFKSLVLHDNLINLDTDMVNPTVSPTCWMVTVPTLYFPSSLPWHSCSAL
uniref:BTB domain-containing protein n=1 Tax=Chelonoidis abingdonii TaxID=106734 RepID=A0A8C0J2F7_CHEAB